MFSGYLHKIQGTRMHETIKQRTSLEAQYDIRPTHDLKNYFRQARAKYQGSKIV